MSDTNNGRTTFVQHLLEIRDAVDRVVEAAEALEFAFRDPSDPWGYSVDAKQDALHEAVRALRAARGEP
jgi:hypothetical protein